MNKYHSPLDRQKAAQSNLTSAQELADLAKSEYGFVRAAVAKNTNTPTEILEQLAPEAIHDKEDYDLSLSLLENTNLPTEIQKRLIRLTTKKIHPDHNGIKFDVEGVIQSGDDIGKKIKITHDEFDTKGYYIFTSNDVDGKLSWYDDWVENLDSLTAYFEENPISIQWDKTNSI